MIEQVCVSASFANPVDRSLDLNGPHLDRGKRVCDGKVRIVVSVNSECNTGELILHSFYAILDMARKASSVCVTENDALGAGIHRLSKGGKGIFRVVVESVKEMLGIVENGFALLSQKAHAVGDKLKIAIECRVQGVFYMHGPTFSEYRNQLRVCIEQGLQVSVG